MKLKRDRYRKDRGGISRLLDIKCERAGHHLFYYQKDGPGIIKRLYIDRIYPMKSKGNNLTCTRCKEILGTKIIYKKEGRPAYRVYVGAITKKIVSTDIVK